MPLHEYKCDACGHRFEAIQKFSDPPVQQCPQCGGAVRKLIASPAIQFKGSGWYITDYAKKDSGAEAGKTKDEGTKASADGKESGGPQKESAAKTDAGAPAAVSPSGAASKTVKE